MDGSRFDQLARSLAGPRSRRGFARLLGGLTAAALPLGFGHRDIAAGGRIGGSPCTRDGQCLTRRCVGPDGKAKCACSRKHARCRQPSDPCKEAACSFATKRCVTTRVATAGCAQDACSAHAECCPPDLPTCHANGLNPAFQQCDGGVCRCWANGLAYYCNKRPVVIADCHQCCDDGDCLQDHPDFPEGTVCRGNGTCGCPEGSVPCWDPVKEKSVCKEGSCS